MTSLSRVIAKNSISSKWCSHWMPVSDDQLKTCISGHDVARPRNYSLSTLVDDISKHIIFIISEIAEI